MGLYRYNDNTEAVRSFGARNTRKAGYRLSNNYLYNGNRYRSTARVGNRIYDYHNPTIYRRNHLVPSWNSDIASEYGVQNRDFFSYKKNISADTSTAVYPPLNSFNLLDRKPRLHSCDDSSEPGLRRSTFQNIIPQKIDAVVQTSLDQQNFVEPLLNYQTAENVRLQPSLDSNITERDITQHPQRNVKPLKIVPVPLNINKAVLQARFSYSLCRYPAALMLLVGFLIKTGRKDKENLTSSEETAAILAIISGLIICIGEIFYGLQLPSSKEGQLGQTYYRLIHSFALILLSIAVLLSTSMSVNRVRDDYTDYTYCTSNFTCYSRHQRLAFGATLIAAALILFFAAAAALILAIIALKRLTQH